MSGYELSESGLVLPDGKTVVPLAIHFAERGMMMPTSHVDMNPGAKSKVKAEIQAPVGGPDDAYPYMEYPTFHQAYKAGMHGAAMLKSEIVALEAAVVQQRGATLGHRRLLPVDKVAPTNQFYQKIVESWGGEAEIVGMSVQIPEDQTSNATTNIKILKYALGVRIPREQYNARSLASAIKYLTRKVQSREGNVCFESCTLPDTDGLVDDAGNSLAVISAWVNAPGTSYVLADLQGLCAYMNVDGFGQQEFKFVLCTDYLNWSEGKRQIKAAGDGGIDFALDTGLIKEAFWDPNMLHGSPLIVAVSPEIAVLAVAEDLTIVVGDEDPSTQSRLITAHIRSSPVIIQANGVGKNTGA